MAVTDYNPLNGNLRRTLGRFLAALVNAGQPRPGAVQGAQRVVSEAMAAGQQIRAGAAPRTVAGAGWIMPIPDLIRTDEEQQAIWGSADAKFGRATTAYGPTPQAISTLSAVDLTVERVAYIHREVDQVGYLTRKADLDFDLLRRDAHLASVHRARVASVYKNKLQFKARSPGKTAAGVCNFVRSVVEDIPSFCKAEEDLLLASANGFSAQEIVWRSPRPITIPLNKGYATVQDAFGVASLEWIHNRDFRWHWIERKWLLDCGGRFIEPFTNPDGSATRKLVMHEGYGHGDPHQRGYMFPADYLCLFKQQGFGRWMVMLEIFGIATPYMQFEESGYASDEDVAAALDFLGNLGRGIPALLSRKYGEVKQTETPAGIDAQGQHAAILGWINAELSKLVQGQTLTMEIGGTGSYGAADVHADSKEDVHIIDAVQEAQTVEHQLARFIVEENAEQLAAALGATPDEICASVPRAFRIIDRRIDPPQRLKMFIDAKTVLGLNVDPAQVEEECNLRVIETGTQDVKVMLTPSDLAGIITVNEARRSSNLGPLLLADGSEDPDGLLTVAAFRAKSEAVATNPSEGDGEEDPGTD